MILKVDVERIEKSMDSSEYKNFKKSMYEEFINSYYVKNMKISFRVPRQKVDELLEKDSTITIERIKNDFAKYPLVRDSILDFKQVVLFPK